MKKNFGFSQTDITIKEVACSLWMDCKLGEGELGIRNQGRFDQSRFSQETVAIGQQTPRNGDRRSKLRFTQEVSSAGRTLDSGSTPPFFSSEKLFYSSENELATLHVANKLQKNLQNILQASQEEKNLTESNLKKAQFNIHSFDLGLPSEGKTKIKMQTENEKHIDNRTEKHIDKSIEKHIDKSIEKKIERESFVLKCNPDFLIFQKSVDLD